MSAAPARVAPAEAGPIGDRTLAELRAVADDVSHGRAISDAAATLLLLCVGPCLAELAAWRDAYRGGAGGTVIPFPGGAR